MKGLANIAFIVALTISAAVAVTNSDANVAQLQTVFEARYTAMKAAMASHDGKAISALLAPDFVSVDVLGKTEDAAQMIKEVQSLPVDPNRISKTTVLSVKNDGGHAIVNQRYDMKTIKTASDGTKKNVELIAVSTDTWTKSGKTWLLQRTVTRQMDYFVNGKSLMHKQAAQQ